MYALACSVLILYFVLRQSVAVCSVKTQNREDRLISTTREKTLNAKVAEEAVARVGDVDPGLILMDWNMPKVTGLEAVHAIRATGIVTPIVMVTTKSEEGRIEEAIRAGSNDYLVKPFTAEALIERVEKFVAD